MRLRHGALAVLLLGGFIGAPAASAAEPAVAERIDPAHSGSAAAPGPPLRQRWTRALEPEENSYPEISCPLVVGDRVFVVAARSLHALSAQTGATLWSVLLGRPASLAYDSGRVIVAATPWVKAFDAATGEERWTRELETDDCEPVAAGGVGRRRRLHEVDVVRLRGARVGRDDAVVARPPAALDLPGHGR